MKQTRTALTAILLAAGIAAVAARHQIAVPRSVTPRLSMVVSTTWLAEHLKDSNLVLLHVGTKEDFAAGHIPGAQFITLADLSAPAGQGLSLELPAADRLATVLEGLGVGDGSRIVVYFSKDQWAQAGRVFVTLDAFGLGDRTAILDGGLPAWQADGRAVTTDVKTPAPARLTLQPRAIVVDYAWVVENGRKAGIALVDARPAEQYTGAKPTGRPPRSGHIPGAVNIPVAQLTLAGARLKSPSDLAELFRAAGVGPGGRVVTYCNIGQQASADYFVARYLGYDVALYDGSMEDWYARGGEVAAEAPAAASGPRWVPQASGTSARLRGVSAVSPSVAWASGSNGTFARTVDGGATWTAAVVPGAEDMDFRDVEAFDADTAYLLSIGPGDRSRIYKTIDGGKTWALQFKNLNPRAFFDAMAFWDEKSGIVMGDPIDGRLVIVRTFDGGLTWIDVPAGNIPPALPGEAAFAASGTCIVTQGKDHVWIGTGGGPEARVFRSADRGFTWAVATTPIAAGTASAGVFSVAFRDAKNGVAVGGDYRKEGDPGENLALTTDGGATWTAPGATRLRGFRSAVAYLPGVASAVIVAAGPAGSDFSVDGGRTWTGIEGPGFHALSLAGIADAGWAVGETGRIAKLAGSLPAGR
jgi:3-mercaptopyruvate sulfurtransferase SseA/photosystem II stability/assembly factor-like uncharacterized protein